MDKKIRWMKYYVVPAFEGEYDDEIKAVYRRRAKMSETTNHVQCVILEHRNATIQTVMIETEVTYGSVQKVIHEEMYMMKESALGSTLADPFPKTNTVRTFEAGVNPFLEQDKNIFFFFAHLVSVDEAPRFLSIQKVKGA